MWVAAELGTPGKAQDAGERDPAARCQGLDGARDMTHNLRKINRRPSINPAQSRQFPRELAAFVFLDYLH
jgi:hypothetical protein